MAPVELAEVVAQLGPMIEPQRAAKALASAALTLTLPPAGPSSLG